MAALQAEVVALRAENAELRATNAELLARLNQNSQNSSRPPSSDPPGGVAPRKQKPSGRRRGGQPGHLKRERALLPVERVDEVVPLKPDKCRRCGHGLRGNDDGPLRHQVTEIPMVRAKVTEYQMHSLVCPGCGTRTTAALPVGVTTSAFGQGLCAMVALWRGAYRLSVRQVVDMARDCFGAEISTGAICGIEKRTSQALEAPWSEAVEHIRQQPVVHADETGWREAKKKAWLWVVATTQVAIFRIQRSRGAAVVKALLTPDFAGILETDRWCAYGFVPLLQRQICWAHLMRHFVGFEDHGPQAKRLGRSLQRQARWMFHLWHRVRDGTLRRATFRRYIRPIRTKILARLEAGTRLPSKKVAGQCREILAMSDALFTFARIIGVEPTNNHAERCLRPAVIWRKCCFGTDSESGSRFVERVMTAVASLRLQRRNVLDFLIAANEAQLCGTPAPSLLPLAAAPSHRLARAA